uniref:Putative secreted protein n=1 Tax=Ixodes ricinus TaxID=34613 RepID=A0A147BTL4_IXORI
MAFLSICFFINPLYSVPLGGAGKQGQNIWHSEPRQARTGHGSKLLQKKPAQKRKCVQTKMLGPARHRTISGQVKCRNNPTTVRRRNGRRMRRKAPGMSCYKFIIGLAL